MLLETAALEARIAELELEVQELRALHTNVPNQEAWDHLDERLTIARVGSWEWDAARDAISGSKEFYRLFDVEPEEIFRFSQFLERVHIDDRERVQQDVTDALNQDRPYDTDYRVRLRDHSWRDINARGRIFTHEGQTVRLVGTCVDITTRKQVEEALSASETKFRSLIENLQVGVVAHAADTSILLSNPMASELLGLTQEQLSGRTAIDPVWCFVDEDGERLALDQFPVYRGLAATSPVSDLVLGVVRPDREAITWLQCSAHAIRNANGEPQLVIVSFLDITVRRETELQLTESKQLIDSVIENVPLMIFLKDAEELQFALFNRAGEELLGFDRKDLLGKSDADFFPAEQAAFFLAKDREVLSSGTLLDIPEEPILTAKNGERLLHTRKVGIKRADGTSKYLLGISEDITDRRRAEEAMRQAEERYRTMFETMLEGFCVVEVLFDDQDTPNDYRFVELNPSFEAQTGLRDVLGKRMSELSLEHEAQWFEVCATVVVTGAPVRFEGERNSLGRWHEVSVYRIGAFESHEVGILLNDITERKRAETAHRQLEEQLRASQKMEAIGSLAGGVAHDFNNLLSLILNYTDFAMDSLQPGDPLENDLSEVKNAAGRAVALTRQLLAFSRKQVLQPVPLSLNQVAANLENMLRRILGEDIDLVQRLSPELGLTLADRGQIEQVLMNLVVNARDAMPAGGKLTIETSNVEVDEEYAGRHVALPPDSYVRLAVSDTGLGMDRDTIERIFEPFFTTKEQGKGTGLGLSTVYGIVKQSGGHIWVHSEPGQGTMFEIHLPRERSATSRVRRQTMVGTRPKGTEVILVVEDEDALRHVVQRSLASLGYQVLTASDGHDAIVKSAQYQGEIDLLLTDVVMPGLSGRVAAETLLKARPTLKVLYMSGYTDDAIVHHGVQEAATHFLPKPFNSTDLARKVREVLDLETQ